MPVCTFIIPTLNRPSLARALQSLRDQTNPDWEAIVIGDGVEPDITLRTFNGQVDMRIQMGKAPRQKSAGLTRNFGIMRAEMICSVPPHFFAFLDDDDHLTPHYVQHLAELGTAYPEAEVIVSRMNDPRLGILPRADNVLALGRVGISFAVRRDVMRDYEFCHERPGQQLHEDWTLMEQFLRDNRNVLISPHVDYLVREAT